MNSRTAAIGSILLSLLPGLAVAEGHGPTFGLATPTLARGQWSSDTVAMSLSTEQGDVIMYREMLGYGFTEDLQGIISFPVERNGMLMPPPRTRVGSMMGAFDEVELSLLWRFDRTAPAIGTRNESALLVGLGLPQSPERAGVRLGPSVNLAAVTGHASRVTYWWLGAGIQHYLAEGDDQLGRLYYASGVFGWRPPLFQADYPKPDWRLFIESLVEIAERDQRNGASLNDSGARKWLAGPSVLGLYGRWGVEAGVLWPIRQTLNGNQPEERYRAKFVFTYWF